MIGDFLFFRNNFRIKIILNNEVELYRNKTLDSSFRGVVFNYLSQILYLNGINRKNFTYFIAQERFVTNQLVFYLQRGHFLADELNAKIEMFQQTGLIAYMMSKYVDISFLKSKRSKQPPSTLNLNQLSAIFWLWLFGIIITLIIFLCECMWSHFKKVNLEFH